ncbi:MAG: tRNA epoxyqueuosine(34) reductase QueG [Candidatus Dormibacteria bacterium]
MNAGQIKEDLFERARELGFVSAGVTTMAPFREARRRALAAIDAGRMDGMPWYSRERVESSSDLRRRYPWGRSIVALAWRYAPARAVHGDAARVLPPQAPVRGRFSAYACLSDEGKPIDYHSLLAAKCDALVAWLRERQPDVRAKRFVDHGWALDRAIAERAGIGFSGKHTQLITREAGSYVLLAEIVLSVSLPPDRASRRSCGTCTACMPACPTGALVAPGVIDARRCIAYLTIEHKGAIDMELRPLMGTWAFGCDLCQEACPINERLAPAPLDMSTATTNTGPVPFPDLVECMQLDDEQFAQRFRGTAVWRTGRAGLARNCAIALGNTADRAAIPALQRAGESDPDEVVREAARWALHRLSAAAPA